MAKAKWTNNDLCNMKLINVRENRKGTHEWTITVTPVYKGHLKMCHLWEVALIIYATYICAIRNGEYYDFLYRQWFALLYVAGSNQYSDLLYQ
jgi:hypothetical protein